MTTLLFLKRLLWVFLFGLSSVQGSAAVLPSEVCNWSSIPLVEFYHPTLDHYFYTTPCTQGELQFVDSGGAGAGWKRTGWSFAVFGSYTTSHRGHSVFRFYGSVSPGPNSHFYTADYDEVLMLRQIEKSTPDNQPRWNFEQTDGFGVIPLVYLHNPALKPCESSYTRIIRRLYNRGTENRRDPNHRFVAETATEVIAEMKSRGWKDEGAVFCVNGAWLNGVEK